MTDVHIYSDDWPNYTLMVFDSQDPGGLTVSVGDADDSHDCNLSSEQVGKLIDALSKVRRSRHEAAFEFLLVNDSFVKDKRRREYNQALFSNEDGSQIWSCVDLEAVMNTYEKATRLLKHLDSAGDCECEWCRHQEGIVNR